MPSKIETKLKIQNTKILENAKRETSMLRNTKSQHETCTPAGVVYDAHVVIIYSLMHEMQFGHRPKSTLCHRQITQYSVLYGHV